MLGCVGGYITVAKPEKDLVIGQALTSSIKVCGRTISVLTVGGVGGVVLFAIDRSYNTTRTRITISHYHK